MRRNGAPWSWIVVVVALGLVAKHPYRSFVQNEALNDLGLANVLPSIFTIILFVLLLSRWSVSWGMLLGLLLGSISYELSQLKYFSETIPAFYSGDQTFDSWDIVASVAGWAVAVVLVRFARQMTAGPHQSAGELLAAAPVAEQSIPAD